MAEYLVEHHDDSVCVCCVRSLPREPTHRVLREYEVSTGGGVLC